MANRIYENFTREADVDSLSDLGLFNLPQAAGRTLMSMAGISLSIIFFSLPYLYHLLIA